MSIALHFVECVVCVCVCVRTGSRERGRSYQLQHPRLPLVLGRNSEKSVYSDLYSTNVLGHNFFRSVA
jgi:hypothetical protein